jgi:hypothetical protein
MCTEQPHDNSYWLRLLLPGHLISFQFMNSSWSARYDCLCQLFLLALHLITMLNFHYGNNGCAMCKA